MERKGERKIESERARENVCVRVCVRERARAFCLHEDKTLTSAKVVPCSTNHSRRRRCSGSSNPTRGGTTLTLGLRFPFTDADLDFADLHIVT